MNSDATPERKPYAYAYERTDLPEKMREFFGPAVHLKQKEVIPQNWTEIPLYTHTAQSTVIRESRITDALVKVVEKAIEALEWHHQQTLADELRAALDKEKDL